MNSHFGTSIEIFDPSSKSRTRRSTFFTHQLERLPHCKASERLGGHSESGHSACPMLRITTIRIDKRIRMVLEGKLVSPWLTELVNEWDSVRTSASGHIVELRDVIMIGEEAEPILMAMVSEDVRFVCRGILNRYVIRRLERNLCEQCRWGTQS